MRRNLAKPVNTDQPECSTSAKLNTGQPERWFQHQNEHNTQLNFACLEKMYHDKMLCDVTLVAENMEIQAHKMMLAGCSAFFYWKFSNDRKLGRLNSIEIKHVKYETLSAVIGYLYTSNILINVGNVGDLITAAYLFGLKDLQQACRGFLQCNLRPETCVSTRKIARSCQCQDLARTVDDYAIANFSDVIKYNEFLELTFDEISTLVSSGLLRPSAEDIFDCVIRWIRFDLQGRHETLYSLMEYVQFSSIPHSSFLERVETEDWLKCDSRFLLNVFKFSNTRIEKPLSELEMLTSPESEKSKMLVTVGITEDCYVAVELFDFEKDIWVAGPSALKIKCRDPSTILAIEGTKIYMVEYDVLKFIDISDANQGNWTCCSHKFGQQDRYQRHFEDPFFNAVLQPGLPSTHPFGSVTLLDNSLYTYRNFGTPARFDLSSNCWMTLSHASSPLAFPGFVTYKRHLYIVGGSLHRSPVAKKYDHNKNSWISLPNMSKQRFHPGIGTHSDMLFVVGGMNSFTQKSTVPVSYNGYGYLTEVETFNLTQENWRTLPDMHVARAAPAVIVVNNKLFVIGGHNDSGNLKSAEIFDAESNTWSMMRCEMNTGLRHVVAGVFDKSLIKLWESSIAHMSSSKSPVDQKQVRRFYRRKAKRVVLAK